MLIGQKKAGPVFVDPSKIQDIELYGLANLVERALGKRNERLSPGDFDRVHSLLKEHRRAVERGDAEDSPLKRLGLHDASIERLAAAAVKGAGIDQLIAACAPDRPEDRTNVNYCVSLNPAAIADPKLRSAGIAIRDAAGGTSILTLHMLMNAMDILAGKEKAAHPIDPAIRAKLSAAIAAGTFDAASLQSIHDFFLEGSNGLLSQGRVKIGGAELKNVFVLPTDIDPDEIEAEKQSVQAAEAQDAQLEAVAADPSDEPAKPDKTKKASRADKPERATAAKADKPEKADKPTKAHKAAKADKAAAKRHEKPSMAALVEYYEARFTKSNLDRVYFEDAEGRLLIAVQDKGMLGNITRGDAVAMYDRADSYTGVGRVLGLKDEYNTYGEVLRRYWIDKLKPRAERVAKKVEVEVTKEAEDGSLWSRFVGPSGGFGVGVLGVLGAAHIGLPATLGAAGLAVAGGTAVQLYKVISNPPDMSVVFDALGVVRLRDDIRPLGA